MTVAASLTGGTTDRSGESLPAWFRSDIQGLRAVAVVAVVAYHAGLPVYGGFAGVDVFFTISGFVITGLLLRHRQRHGRLGLLSFYRQRARRLLPAAGVMITATVVVVGLLMSPLGTQQQTVALAAMFASLLASNAYFATDPGGYMPLLADNPLLHTWSLGVEEQFYLSVPAIALLVGRLRRRSTSFTAVGLIAAAMLISFAVCLAAASGGSDEIGGELGSMTWTNIAFYSPVTRAWEFLAGCLLAVLVARGSRPSRAMAATAGTLGAAGLIATFTVVGDIRFWPGWATVVAVWATVAVLWAGVSNSASPVNRALGSRWPARIGALSYGWYLWHWPFIVFAGQWFGRSDDVLVTAAALALLPAAASYWFVERFTRDRNRFPSRRATALLLTASVAVPFTAGLLLLTAWSQAWWRSDVAALQMDLLDAPPTADPFCSADPFGETKHPCGPTTSGALGRILLIGDSNAGHIREPLSRAAARLGYDLDSVTRGGCPFVVQVNYPDPGCAAFVRRGEANLEQRKDEYAAIVISNSTGYVGSSAPRFTTQSLPRDATVREARVSAAMAEGYRQLLTDLVGRTPVIVVAGIPQLRGSDLFPVCMLRTPFTQMDPTCAAPAPAGVARAARVATDLAASMPVGVTLFDLRQGLCDGNGPCRALLAGRPLYRDSSHLSRFGASRYEEPLHLQLRRLLGGQRSRGVTVAAGDATAQ